MATRDEKGLAFATDAALEDWAGRPWVLPAVLLLAAALRVAHLLSFRASPFFATLTLDARYYDQWAQRIAGGEWIGRAAFWVDPLYAYVLGVVYAVGGHDLLLPRLLNLACGVLTVWLVARIARRVWGSQLAAVVAALLAVALFVPAIHFEGQVEKTALSVLLLAAAARRLPRRQPARRSRGRRRHRPRGTGARQRAGLRAAGGAGPGAGLGSRTRRPARRARRATLAARRRSSSSPPCRLIAAGDAAQLRRQPASCVPTTTNLGVNLYLGNHAGNQYGYYEPPDFLHPSTDSEVPDFRAEAARRGAGALTDRALSDYWAGAAGDALRADPGSPSRAPFTSCSCPATTRRCPTARTSPSSPHWSPLLRAPLLWFGQLLALATPRRRRRLAPPRGAHAGGGGAVYLASLLPFFIFARLRVQLLPPLAVLGGGALAWLAAALRARQGRPVAIAAAILAVAGRGRLVPAGVDGAASHRLAGHRLAQHGRRLRRPGAARGGVATPSPTPRRSIAPRCRRRCACWRPTTARTATTCTPRRRCAS